MQPNFGGCLQRVSLPVRKLVVEPAGLAKKKLGDKHDESLIQILFKRKGNVCQLLYENIKPSSNKLKKNKSYLSKWASLPRVFGRVSDGYVTKGLMRFGNHCGMFCFSEKYMLVGK